MSRLSSRAFTLAMACNGSLARSGARLGRAGQKYRQRRMKRCGSMSIFTPSHPSVPMVNGLRHWSGGGAGAASGPLNDGRGTPNGVSERQRALAARTTADLVSPRSPQAC